MPNIRSIVYFKTRSSTEKRILEAACVEYNVSPELMDELLGVEIEHVGRLRRRGIFNDLRSVIEHHAQEHQDDYS